MRISVTFILVNFKLLLFQQNLLIKDRVGVKNMEKKLPLARKTNPINLQQSQPESTTFKNENVIFKIHTPKGQQNYNAKTFPAKFSINICNQPTELASGMYNREPTQHGFSVPMATSISKNEFEPVKTQRISPNLDFQNYDKQIKAILQDKRKCDQLIRQLEQTCEEYQYQNQDLVNSLNQASLKIQQNSEKISEKQKNQEELKENILMLKYQNKELKQKIKQLQNQIKKQKQASTSKLNAEHSEILKLQRKIAELEQVIRQKEQAIKNFSNFNNEIAKKFLDEQSYSSASHVKKMEKWLKSMGKKEIQNCNSLNSNAQSSQNAYVAQLLIKCQKMSIKINELEKVAHYLDHDFKQAIKQNEALTIINQEHQKTIKDLQNSLQQQFGKDTQQSFCRKSWNQGGTIIYEGSIKVKMEALLIQKDKRISSLEQELMEARKQNSMLKTKIYQADLQRIHFQQTMNFKEDYSLKKAKSLQKFYYQAKNDNLSTPKEDRQLHRIYSQCNNLTETLGNFMEAYKPDRSIFDEKRRSRFSHAYEPNLCPRDENKDKIQELVELQKATYEMLQRNLKKQGISFEQTKWNNNRYLDLGRLQKQHSQSYQFQNFATTERTPKPDLGWRRTQRSHKSYFLNQDK